jgi:opacity protein-like surface antigen
MKIMLLAGIAAAVLTTVASADPVTKTVTIDNNKYEGTKTITRDKEAGTLSKDTDVTRKSDGATASRDYDRQRTDNGFTASGSATNFNGQTRSFDYERDRTAHGYNAEGTITRFNGQTYDYTAKLRRGENRVARSQVLRNDQGQVVAARRSIRPRRMR